MLNEDDMSYRKQPEHDPSPYDDSEVNRAIDAMTAGELRALLRIMRDRLEYEPLVELEGTLIAHAARGSAGWKPTGPPPTILDEVGEFVTAARRIGHADPEEVDYFLWQSRNAFLAGDSEVARTIIDTLIPPIVECEIDLGQHEMLDEVLTADLQECSAQYLASVYITSSGKDRPAALRAAIDVVDPITWVHAPIEQMETVSATPLPDLDDFLPRWIVLLEAETGVVGERERSSARWLREAVKRFEGVSGLERIARKTKQPEMLLAWCRAVVETDDWEQALRAYEDAARLTAGPLWRGDFLDGVALAARQLGRDDFTQRLIEAWCGSPSLERLLRWLGEGDPSADEICRRAGEAFSVYPTNNKRQQGLLKILNGELQIAAELLAGTPGLGWSAFDHPGHLLFTAFAALLAEGKRTGLSTRLLAELDDRVRDPYSLSRFDDNKPRLETPSLAALIAKVRPAMEIDATERRTILEAMKTAATNRVEGVLDRKRRRVYGHAATLVLCCLELAPAAGMQEEVARWVEDLRGEYRRFRAFQKEIEMALDQMRSSPHEESDPN